jgi:hypothetical protein
VESCSVWGGLCCIWKTSSCETYNRRLGYFLVLPSASLTPARVDPASNNGGGRTYKAHHKDYWPPAAESITLTLWHGGGLLPTLSMTTFVATPDFKSLLGWVQRRVTPPELIAAYDMPVDEQTQLNQAWRDNFLSTLLGRPSVCVLRLFPDALVPIFDPKTFRGGGSVRN